MKTYAAKAYALGPGLGLCRYSPEPDMHFPLAIDESVGWRILTWLIVPKEDKSTDYLVAVAALDRGGAPFPSELPFFTQFGPRCLGLGPPAPFDAIEQRFAESIAPALLRAAGSESPELTSVIVEALGPRLRAIAKTSAPLKGEKRRDGAPQLIVEGLRAATYVVALDAKDDWLGVVAGTTIEAGETTRTVVCPAKAGVFSRR